jgi:predicted ArsR family transcriptional regulator
MDPFDIEILNQLADGKPKVFNQILAAAKLSHNTLRHHLDSLIEQKIVTRSKHPAKGRGRPKFTYSAKVGVRGVPVLLPSPSIGVVSLTFERLSQICRFEKGGFCKRVRGPCSARVCPQIL